MQFLAGGGSFANLLDISSQQYPMILNEIAAAQISA